MVKKSVKKKVKPTSTKSDLPDYDAVRKGTSKKLGNKKRERNLYLLTGIIFIAGVLVMLFFDDLRFFLPDNFLLVPVIIVAFVLVWGFFLPDLIMQEIVKVVTEIPDAVRLLSHVIYSYLLAWLLVEFITQLQTRESKKVLILTGSVIVVLVLLVTATLVRFGII